MNRLLFASLLTLLVFGCTHKPDDAEQKKLLIGDWIGLKARNGLAPGSGYTFYPNDTVDVKFDLWFRDNSNLDKPDKHYGPFTTYMLKDDSLFVFQPGYNKWDTEKIVMLTNDTLALMYRDGKIEKLLNRHYRLDTLPNFDKICISTSPCFGDCDVTNTTLSSEGTIILEGGGLQGLFKYRVSKNRFEELWNGFRKVDIKTLKTDYDAHCTDVQAVWITFIKDGKIYKSVRDYGRCSPAELIWAYTPILYLYKTIDKLKLDSVQEPKNIYSIRFFSFIRSDSVSKMYPSDELVLMDYLRNGVKTNATFKKTYVQDIWFSDRPEKGIVTKIESDGRYYKFTLKGCAPLTIDIGFNFLERNTSILKFDKIDHSRDTFHLR